MSRKRRQREHQKSTQLYTGLESQINSSASAVHFLFNFLAVTTRLRREIAKFHKQTTNFSFELGYS